jgi:hypothetical protein
MTTYAGETLTVTHTATYKGIELTDVDVQVFITIRDSDAVVVVAESEMTWDPVAEHWEYLWDTTGVDAGTYRAQVMIDDDNWEYKNIRLKVDA